MNDDLISRLAAIDTYLETVSSLCVDEGDGILTACARDRDILEMLENLPSAQPKTGRWEPLFGTMGKVFKCSECGAVVTVAYECFKDGCYYDYCPYCGAKMKGETE